MGIKENLQKIKEQIGSNKVKIIAVTKYAGWEQITEAYNLGINNFGESYVQDALKKLSEHKLDEFKNIVWWHFIGKLQKNKAKFAVGNFSLIQSVDSVELAKLINKVAIQKGATQNILLQVNISNEEQRVGFKKDILKNNLCELLELKNINIEGLMTIAPNTNDTSSVREHFLELVTLKDYLNKDFNVNLKEVSMGMSNDYKIAIECGSTMIRIGRALFKQDS